MLSGSARIVDVEQKAGFDEWARLVLDLEVHVEGIEPYRVEHTQVFDDDLLRHLQPGSTIPVEVDPEDRDDVRVDPSGWERRAYDAALAPPPPDTRAGVTTSLARARDAHITFLKLSIPAWFVSLAACGVAMYHKWPSDDIAGALFGASFFSFFAAWTLLMIVHGLAESRLRARLARTGVERSVELLGVNDTTGRDNDQPLLELWLRLSLEGRNALVIRHCEIVQKFRVVRLVPGEPVDILVDPDRPERLVLCWRR